MGIWHTIETHLSEVRAQAFAIRKRHPVGGGCINQAFRIDDSDTSYFVKLNHASSLNAFRQEAAVLDAILAENALRAPQPICHGLAESQAYLVLEYIAPGTTRKTSWEQLGQQLAAFHRKPQSHHGWHCDNVIGSTPQPNQPNDDWIDFFRQHRLLHQLALCQRNGYVPTGMDRLLENLEIFFSDYIPYPSLLHGDLWSGNVGFDTESAPFVFDPAIYCGDRETDLAFTEFFGGFHASFYQAYHEALPLDSGYSRRKDLYNLYHCLNHFNLFGGSYAQQSQAIIEKLNHAF